MFEETAGTPNNFIVARKEVLMDRKLSSTEKLVYARICSFDTYFESTGNCAELLGLSKRQVENARRKLEKMGYIKCLENTGRGKKYKALYDLPDKVSQSSQEMQLRVPKIAEQSSKNCNSEFQKLHTYNKDIKESIKERLDILSKDSIGESPKIEYGNGGINEVFDEWEKAFDYRPRNSQANRRAAYNLLRSKDVGKEKLVGIIRALPKLQMQTFCVGSVKKVSDFASLQREWDSVWNMAYREWKKQKETGGAKDWRI